MHRVDTKRQKKKVLRVAAYSVTLILTAFTTIVLLYVALGYRLDRESGHVVKSGLLLVDTKPEAAAIYINDEEKDSQAPGRFVLPAGKYNLLLRREGYREWRKTVAVQASMVREVNYPLLIPSTLKPTTMAETEAPTFVSQSLNRKYLLTHQPNQTNLILTEVGPQEASQTLLSLTDVLGRENGQVGSLRVIEWGLNNKQVLLEQTLPSGAVHRISFDITKPHEAVDITRLYGANVPEDIHYVGGKTDEIYGLKNGILSIYSLSKPETQTLLQNVRSYQPYGDDTVLFDRAAAQNAEIGVWHNKVATVIETGQLAAAPALLRYASYDGDDYFVIAQPDGEAITIYKNPIKKPILAKQLPLTTLTLEKTSKLDFSASSRFVLAQSGSNVLVYDLDELVKKTFALPFPVENSTISWFDAFHLQARATTGEAFVMDYDGQNREQLSVIAGSTKLYFAPDYQFMYSFVPSGGSNSLLLQNTPLTISN